MQLKDIPKFLKHCDEKLQPCVIIAVNTGLRYIEQFSLQWTDMDLDKSRLSVLRSRQDRVIALNPEAIEAFKRIPKQVDSPYVFCKADGKPTFNVKKAFQQAKKESGMEDLIWHDFRKIAMLKFLGHTK